MLDAEKCLHKKRFIQSLKMLFKKIYMEWYDLMCLFITHFHDTFSHYMSYQ